MGEAKKRKEALKELFLKQLERWSFPPSPEEAQAVAEIEKLPILTVQRCSEQELAYMRMKPNQCHANARFMEDNDPLKECKQIAGYWPQAGNYVFHSVVERGGQLFCVTPISIKSPDEFSFIPDPDIEWKIEGDYRTAYRKGIKVDPGFRSDPAEHQRISGIILSRLESGMDPIRAGEPPF